VLLKHCDATYTSIRHHIANHLKMAPHRQGGAGRGCCIPSHLLNRTSPASTELVEEDVQGDESSEDIDDEDNDDGDNYDSDSEAADVEMRLSAIHV